MNVTFNAPRQVHVKYEVNLFLSAATRRICLPRLNQRTIATLPNCQIFGYESTK